MSPMKNPPQILRPLLWLECLSFPSQGVWGKLVLPQIWYRIAPTPIRKTMVWTSDNLSVLDCEYVTLLTALSNHGQGP
ncbi:hypothetical protein CC2G_011644 [Coprinopsis cinerea AmutBmut pab1-1]|nr:hypothetical protein CC2G_011644 [Coprinopsis cinerea AmutBmut pab1-1]